MSDRDDLEALAARLEASGDYKVLRRLRRTPRIDRGALPDGAREAVVLDLETTGLDPNLEVPIEVGLVRFAYDPQGRILGVTDELSALEDPGRPLTPEVVRLTGITDADVAGQRFPDERVGEVLDGAVLVIAHNAAFDRPFAEKRWPALGAFPWACSLRDVPWRDGELALNRMRRTAGATTVRLWAVQSPFDSKDLLKARGYRWNGAAKVWWTDVPEDALEAERAFLAAEVYPRGLPELPTLRVDARVRYSARVPESPPHR
jgi:DNA polymerase-3 subunit epsilon